MKLYAKITSERASKGQGGNKYLEIELLVGSRDDQNDAGIVSLTDEGDHFAVRYTTPQGKHTEELLTLPKKAKCKECNQLAYLSGVDLCPPCSSKWVKS